MSKWIVSLVLVVFLGLLSIVTACAPTGAVKPAEFYKTNTIDLTIPSAAGSSVDVFVRMTEPFLRKYTGAGGVITTNVREAGGLQGYNSVYRAEPNGLHIGGGSRTMAPLNDIMGEPGIEFETDKFLWLFGVDNAKYTVSVKAGGRYNSLADLKAAKNLKFVATSAAGGFAMSSVCAIHAIGLDAKVFSGWKSPADCELSLMQGEIDVYCVASDSAMPAIKSGTIKPLCILAPERDSCFPDVPALTELMSLEGDRKEVVELWRYLGVGRTFFATPGIPEDRLEFLRKAFMEMAKDPQFVQTLDKISNRTNVPIDSGEDVQKQMNTLMSQKARIKGLFEDLFKRYRA